MKHLSVLLTLTLLLIVSNSAFAACEIDIEAGDGLSYSLDTIEVESSCEEVTINFTHTGQMPVEAMGHNWVLTATTDFQAVATAGMSAGADNNYVPVDDERVIAYTSVIGGGGETSVTFSISDLDPAGSYTFFCSFPGHWGVMKGEFKII